MVYQSYLLRRKIVHYTFVLTSATSTTFSKKIIILSHLFLICLTYLTKPKYILRQIFAIFTIQFALPIVMNKKLLSELINDLISNLLDVCILIYLNDILIYLNNISEHHQHIKEVLKCFYKTGLDTKAEKCKFYSELVEYLEYIISSSSLIIFNNKVKIIQDQPKPKKVKNIQSFLGFANFHHQFIFNYLDIINLIDISHLEGYFLEV